LRYIKCKSLKKDWSVITLGCWQIAPSEGWGDICSPQSADAVVKKSLDYGISAFDTAEGYGDGESERRLGKALGHKKQDVIIISKIWPDAFLTADDYHKRLNNSLKALNREYVDVYLVHFPSNYFNSTEQSEKLCKLMGELKESGKAITVGLSNFMEQDILLLGKGVQEFDINQVPYNILQRDYEGKTRDICHKNEIGYMAYSPTAQGLLAGRLSNEATAFPARKWNKLYKEPLLTKSKPVRSLINNIAEEINTKPISVALAWVLEQKNILTTIVGSRKPDQVSEFAFAGNLKLSADHLNQLNNASNSFHKK
jgi:aryl-alcohol dehydrogenase-like predicted oxidoreductase